MLLVLRHLHVYKISVKLLAHPITLGTWILILRGARLVFLNEFFCHFHDSMMFLFFLRWAILASVDLSTLSSSFELLAAFSMTPNHLLFLKCALLHLYHFPLELWPPHDHCYKQECFLQSQDR
ncbi:hypothetical protein NPIL_634961 [Nephila pilipes]|uniref:Uncharacterized protein n=1 Tax=Nephila pilipes TaxID=299642 RepID=A0A8X6N461_NEPPI|nr:hypothetical protein NPIL_634961 [Nephila pilipes]